MPLLRAMRLLNGLDAGTITGAMLETKLQDKSVLAELNMVLDIRSQAKRISKSSNAMTAVASSSTAMTAVSASSTAMTAVRGSKTALTAIWGSETALTAIRNNSTAISTLVGSPYTSYFVNNPSNLQSTMVASKSILLQHYNSSGTADYNYLRVLYANGVSQGDVSYTTTTSWSYPVRAFTDIRHYSWVNNHNWYGYIIKCD